MRWEFTVEYDGADRMVRFLCFADVDASRCNEILGGLFDDRLLRTFTNVVTDYGKFESHVPVRTSRLFHCIRVLRNSRVHFAHLGLSREDR